MSLTHRWERLRSNVEAHVGAFGTNALADPEWPLLRETLLRETQPWPEVHASIEEAIHFLEGQKWCVWRQHPLPPGTVSAQKVLYKALEEHMPARIAVAEALVELSREKR